METKKIVKVNKMLKEEVLKEMKSLESKNQKNSRHYRNLEARILEINKK